MGLFSTRVGVRTRVHPDSSRLSTRLLQKKFLAGKFCKIRNLWNSKMKRKKAIKIKSFIESKIDVKPQWDSNPGHFGDCCYIKTHCLANNIKFSKIYYFISLKYSIVRTFLALKIINKYSNSRDKIYKPGKNFAYFVLVIQPFCLVKSK